MTPTTYDLTYTSGMFTTHQLKPRTAVSLAFTGWAHWLTSRDLSHATLITRHRTGFVPVGVGLDYDQAHDFLDGDTLTVTTTVTTWQPRRFPTCQESRTRIQAGHKVLARVLLQMICVRIESDASLAATPATMPEALNTPLLDPTRDDHRPPRYLSRTPPPADDSEPLLKDHDHPFTVHRGMCEIGDQWYFESIPDLLGAAREDLTFAHAPTHRALLPGLSRPLIRLRYGLRRPLCFLDTGTVRTTVRTTGDQIHFIHQILTAAGHTAGHALETLPTKE